MKNIFILLLLASSVQLFAQQDAGTLPPYKKYPTHPPLQLLLSDSTTKFTTESLPQQKQVLVMLFSPECEHCQHEAEELVAHKNEFRDIQIVMATTYPLWKMNQFITDYKLKEIDNIVIGRDIFYLLPAFFDMRNFPFLAMYNAKGNLIEVFEGGLPIPKVLEKFKNNP